jgi:hypothetical protein
MEEFFPPPPNAMDVLGVIKELQKHLPREPVVYGSKLLQLPNDFASTLPPLPIPLG